MPRRLRASQADYAICADLIKTGSRSFFAAGRLLPHSARQAAFAIYGFCRLSDDAVDEDRGGLDAVKRLRARLARAAAGAPDEHPIDRALSDVMAAYAIPEELLAALLEGMAWDAEGRRCHDETEMLAYAARVAAAVGAVMACLMGARDRFRLARACDLGVAMQLTNIARDIGEDARAGRLYLPLAWLEEEGIDPEAFLAAPIFEPRIAGLTRRLLRLADGLYRRAETGIAALPYAFRPAIWAARLIYAEIGAAIEQAGFDSLSRRAVVSGRRKASLMAQAVARAQLGRAPGEEAACLRECAFLVDAAYRPDEAQSAGQGLRGFDADVAWVMDLFVDLSRREATAGSIRWREGRS